MSYVKGRLCAGCMIFVVQNSVHKCSENHLKEDTAAGKVNKYKLIKSKDDEPNINNSLKTVNKKLLKNTNSLEISDFNDVSAENYKKSEEEGVAKIDMPKLIELIEPCAPLWNFKLSLSERSDTIKSNLWNSIYVNFNGKYSIPALKKSWKYLKEKYTREKKIAPSGSASIKREWPHLKSLQFLDDVVLCQKRTTDSIPSTTGSIHNASEEFDTDEPSKRKKKSLMGDHMSMLIDELKNSRPIPPTPPEPEQFNEDRDFCAYLASIMVGMPRNAKLKLQRKIINMVIEQIE